MDNKTLGVLGGGQLAQMLAPAVHALGWKLHVYTPEDNSPARQVADKTTVASFDDKEALAAFAQSVAMVTLEFENIPLMTLQWLERQVPVFPSANVLAVSQHRVVEKATLQDLGVPVTPFAAVTSPESLLAAMNHTGVPAILKTASLGYDGKGQWRVDTELSLEDARALLAECESAYPNPDGYILEKRQAFTSECSVIVARNGHGDMRVLGPFENTHRNGILHTTVFPAPSLTDRLAEQARRLGMQVAQGLGVVGLLCVELFVTGNPEQPLLANEIAPRPHNSGHITQNLSAPSQFDAHAQALILETFPERHDLPENEYGVMLNLLGECCPDESTPLDASVVAKIPEATLHWYGKSVARPGRKMGHINWVSQQKPVGEGLTAMEQLHQKLVSSPVNVG